MGSPPQWVLDAYLLTLGSLVLVGGALGDLLGRTRVFRWGVVGFLLASVACGLAPNAAALVGARAFQGLAAALLVPGSLALLSANFTEQDRGRAIGAWSGLVGIVTALGPFVGAPWSTPQPPGWRWVFPHQRAAGSGRGPAAAHGTDGSWKPLRWPAHRPGRPARCRTHDRRTGLGGRTPDRNRTSPGSVWASALCATGLTVLGIFVWGNIDAKYSGSPEPMLPRVCGGSARSPWQTPSPS